MNCLGSDVSCVERGSLCGVLCEEIGFVDRECTLNNLAAIASAYLQHGFHFSNPNPFVGKLDSQDSRNLVYEEAEARAKKYRNMSSSKKVYTREEWEKKLSEVKIRKGDMNKLVMNFLVTEGYVEAAEKFHMETGTEPDMDLGTITDRMEVRKAIQCGNVQDAIEKVNDLNPEILDTNPQLFFHLQQQRLIELIRIGKVEEALEFAQEELAPRGEENHAFLQELERTVALLAFEDTSTCPVGELLDVSQRQKTASELNAAILTSQSHEKDPKLPGLLKMLIWVQNQLDEKVSYPRINDLANATLEDPAS